MGPVRATKQMRLLEKIYFVEDSIDSINCLQKFPIYIWVLENFLESHRLPLSFNIK